ncbi:hypothetical protein BDF19DRAFT_410710 [Syncephalis fuscata]|nr:hypothetical protein BDF19DRAFT_410710 [Syncephalis fuscata]
MTMKMESQLVVDDDATAITLLTNKLEQIQIDSDQFRLQAQTLKEQAAKLAKDNEHDQKYITNLHQSLQDVQAERERLEMQVYSHQQENDSLQQEVQLSLRRQREAEKLQEKEASSNDRKGACFMGRKGVFSSGSITTLQRQLHRALETQQEQQAHARQVANGDHDNTEQSKAQQRELMIARKNIREQDKLILELRDRIEQEHSNITHTTDQYNAQALRVTILETEIKQLKDLNQSLQEDNESYQILLQEKTMNGDFMLRSVSETSLPATSTSTGLGLDLATELTRAMSPPGSPRIGPAPGLVDSLEYRLKNENTKLAGEVKTLKDENKALTLYINKILSRIMENKQLVNVLARDYEKPEEPLKSPPPRRRSSLMVTPSMLSPRNSANNKTDDPRLRDPPKTAGLVSSISLSNTITPKSPILTSPPKSPTLSSETDERPGYMRRWRRHQSMSMSRSAANDVMSGVG